MGFLEKEKIGFNKLRFCLDGLPQFFGSKLNGFVDMAYEESAFWRITTKTTIFNITFPERLK